MLPIRNTSFAACIERWCHVSTSNISEEIAFMLIKYFLPELSWSQQLGKAKGVLLFPASS